MRDFAMETFIPTSPFPLSSRDPDKRPPEQDRMLNSPPSPLRMSPVWELILSGESSLGDKRRGLFEELNEGEVLYRTGWPVVDDRLHYAGVTE